MNKSIRILLIILLTFILLPINVNAKTLGELKSQYENLQKQYNDKKNQIQYTESEITSAKARIESIYGELAQANKEIQNINSEISRLNSEILKKDNELKELMKFFQISQGESTYLEYIFSADSITDFIYRISVTEQLSKYNDKLINDMHAMIEENNKNIEKLHKKEESLKKLQNELAEKVQVLGKEKAALDDEEADIEAEIKDSLTIINYYKNAGCTDDQDISDCARGQLPVGTKFWRPTDSGFMQSKWNLDPLSGGGFRYHAGVDISNNGGTKIYSISDGKVIVVNHYYVPMQGYGKYIIIQHNINGKIYTSLYGHLSGINVKAGDIVTKDTVIGYMGNTGHSFGNHLHLNICLGESSCQSLSQTVDPRNYINFPAHYTWYYDRKTYYK